MTFRPLLAAPIKSHADLSKLDFPMIASPKLDGIRVLIHPEFGPVTRKLKPIPNRSVRERLNFAKYIGLDGEIIVGPPTAKDVFNVTSSAVMSHDGEPDFVFHTFDSFTNPEAHYIRRLEAVHQQVLGASPVAPSNSVQVLQSQRVTNVGEVLDLEHIYLKAGYEGVMLRNLFGIYKFNRSTFKEQILLKLKTFTDTEATVIGFEEQYHNANEAEEDALGHTKRSTDQENLLPMNTLGALVCESEKFTKTFKVGTGFSQAQRQEIWDARDTFMGQQLKFKYQEVGTKDRPRIPSFLGWRKD